MQTNQQCEDHSRDITLFCNEPGCQESICQICMVQNHKRHDILDLEQLQEKRYETLLDNIESLKNNLQSNRQKVLETKTKLDEKLNICML